MGKKKQKKHNPLAVGYDDSHWSGYSGGGTKSYGRTVFYAKRAKLVRANGEVIADVPVCGYTSDWTAFKKAFPVEVTGDEKNLVETAILPAEEWEKLLEDVTLSKKKPMACLYTAVEQYCKSILGVSFESEDRTFFDNHPLTQEDGVPFPDTLRVAQELIEPYGLRISRVQVKPNYGVRGDLIKWQRVLGCNPLGMGDRMTSNQQFIERFKLEGKEDPQAYRFEYSETALFPSVGCGTLLGGSDKGITGLTNGHAVYIPPRRRANGALLSFQIDRAALVPWKSPPVFDAIPADKDKIVKCFDLADWYDNHRPKGIVHTVVGAIIPSLPEKRNDNTPATEFAKPKCYMCHRADKTRKHNYNLNGICDECWNLFCEDWYCNVKTCENGSAMHSVPAFRFSAFSPGSSMVYIQCNTCHKMYGLGEADNKDAKHLARFIKSIRKYMEVNNLKTYSVRGTPDSTPTTKGGDVQVPNDTIPHSD